MRVEEENRGEREGVIFAETRRERRDFEVGSWSSRSGPFCSVFVICFVVFLCTMLVVFFDTPFFPIEVICTFLSPCSSLELDFRVV